jgi:outer membrane protein TolC
VHQQALVLAQQLLSESRRRVEAGDLAPLNVKLAESQAETVQANITVAEQLRVERQNALKSLLSDNLENWVNVEIDPAETLIATETPLDRQASWLAALANRPDLEELRLELEKRNVLVRYARNQLYPNLDLIGGVGVQAYGAGAGQAWTTVRNGQQSFYSVGIMLSMPLSRTAARNNHKASKAAQEQATLRLQRQEQKAFLRVDTAIKGVESAFSRVESTRKARGYAEDALAAEQKKFQTGASTSFLVQEFQRNLTAARTAEIQALADYHKAIATLHLEEGTTLIKHDVEVNVR